MSELDTVNTLQTLLLTDGFAGRGLPDDFVLLSVNVPPFEGAEQWETPAYYVFEVAEDRTITEVARYGIIAQGTHTLLPTIQSSLDPTDPRFVAVREYAVTHLNAMLELRGAEQTSVEELMANPTTVEQDA